MKNTYGNSISLTLFGESHGKAIGAVIDGLAPGLKVSEENIERLLSKRRPDGISSTPRIERDGFEILSGVFNGKTTGTPIAIVIPNENTRSSDYSLKIARPSHADYSAYCKYHGFEDYRGGGHFSGRITAALVAAGAIFIDALSEIGIKLGTHILSCAGESDRAFCDAESDIELLSLSAFPTLSDESAQAMTEKIISARERGDSVGGITQSAVTGLPAGLGEPWFDSVEGALSRALFAIGGVKGVEFGLGFGFSKKCASEVNDAFALDGERVVTKTNNNGGINGGITNGMPVIFQCAVKPTPSISISQDTVNFIEHTELSHSIKGRHDPAIIRRICPVIDSVTALVICDMLASRYGTDVLAKGICK